MLLAIREAEACWRDAFAPAVPHEPSDSRPDAGLGPGGFDPDVRAFYYARVLEIPIPRWTAYDAKYFGVDLPDEVPMSIQQRAYTSPIWYTPQIDAR